MPNMRCSPTTPPTPEYPFQYLCSDFFYYMGKYYLVSVDRYFNWSIVDRAKDGSAGLINCLRRSFVSYDIFEGLASDGGPEFTSQSTESFLKSWGFRQHISSTAFPHSNSRAEIGVKTVKRMIISNTDASGNLDTDAFQKLCSSTEIHHNQKRKSHLLYVSLAIPSDHLYQSYLESIVHIPLGKTPSRSAKKPYDYVISRLLNDLPS